MHFSVLVVGTRFGGDEVDELLFPYWFYPNLYSVEERREDHRFVFDKVDLESEFKRDKKINFKHKKSYERYETAEDWAKEHPFLCYEEGQGWGFWSNPNGKGGNWDWYSIGGRWTGFFLLKDGAKMNLGIPRVFMRSPTNPRAVDQARKCDIDWEAMRRRARERAEQSWEEANRMPESKREHYGIRPDDTKQSYVERNEKDACLPEVVLMEGEWEKGTFSKEWEKEYRRLRDGWSDEENREKWEKDRQKLLNGDWHEENRGKWGEWEDEFQELFERIPEDAVLTLVDCHI
jgi:hypothetical protein